MEYNTTLEKYPQWCKFCKNIVATEIKESATYHDITTLLWIPLKITHFITKVKPYEELHFFLSLPGESKMWYKVFFKQQGKKSYMMTEVTFDLGSKLRNATVGRVLEKRWIKLLEQGFLDWMKRNC